MASHWTLRVARKVRGMGPVFGPDQRHSYVDDADARRIRSELDAIRARFPDHA